MNWSLMGERFIYRKFPIDPDQKYLIGTRKGWNEFFQAVYIGAFPTLL